MEEEAERRRSSQLFTVLIPVVLHDLNWPCTIMTEHKRWVEHHHLVMITAVFFSFPAKGMMGAEVTETNNLSLSIKSTADPTMIFFSMDYGKFG